MGSVGNKLLLAVVLVIATPVVGEGEIAPAEAVGDVAELIRQLVEQHHHLKGCHLLLITSSSDSSVFYNMIRYLSEDMKAGSVVDISALLEQDQSVQDHLLKRLWVEATFTCRTLVLHLNSDQILTNQTLRLLESSGLWERPLVRVVVVGDQAGVGNNSVLLRRCFRNTIHAVSLVTGQHSPQDDPRSLFPLQRKGRREEVLVYRRCLYCRSGQPDVRLILRLNSASGLQHIDQLFEEQTQNLMGHKLRGAMVRFYPYTDYERNSDERGTTITPKDSLDTRLLMALSSALNFTFELHENPELTWGKGKDGKFNGMVGQLQREEKDFSTSTAPQPHRLRVINHVRGYPSDLMTVISLQPSVLPQHLAFIRPFTEELWVALLVMVVVWGVILWLLQRTWWWMTGGSKVRFSTSLLYSWGVLLERACTDPSVSSSAQVLLGWWLLFCLVIATGFRSSLISHLTVQEKSRPPETLADLLEKSSWKWGIDSNFYKASAYEYFTQHEDPVVREVTKTMEVLEPKVALQKVLANSYTLIGFKYSISKVIAVHFTDFRGQSPFFISNKGFYVLPFLGWGIRKGAPYLLRINELMLRLEASGITSYWSDDVIVTFERNTRLAASLDSQGEGYAVQDEANEVVLGLDHLQGAFYLLLLGSNIALLTLVAERHVLPSSSS